jgi:hypothetical protein
MIMREQGAEPETRDDHPGQPDQPFWPGGQSAPDWQSTALPPQPATVPRLSTPSPSALARIADLAESEQPITGKRKRVTDSNGAPALRLNRDSSGPLATSHGPAKVYEMNRAPGYLRLMRLAVGLALLEAAWAAGLLLVSLGRALWLATPSEPVLNPRLALYGLEAFGLLWLAVVGLGMVVVGVFSLFIGLTRRGW